MMSDKELLEMAAKGAGIPKHMLYDSIGDNGGIEEKGWNPLEDDGDALRLAVKLSMKVYVGEAYPWHDDAADYLNGVSVDEDECSCPYAATRRAIVRAAASIGEAME